MIQSPTVDLSAFARMLLARGWIPLVLGMLGAAGALAFAQTRAPLYEGLTRVRLELSRPSDFAQTQATKELLASNVEDLRTHDMAAATEARLGRAWLTEHGLDEGALHALLDRGRIGASADINVFELQIKVWSSKFRLKTENYFDEFIRYFRKNGMYQTAVEGRLFF